MDISPYISQWCRQSYFLHTKSCGCLL